MSGAQPINPYTDIDPRESFVAVRECTELLNISADDVIELAKCGTLRSRGLLLQPALIAGYTT
jgi:hypothetical protein